MSHDAFFHKSHKLYMCFWDVDVTAVRSRSQRVTNIFKSLRTRHHDMARHGLYSIFYYVPVFKRKKHDLDWRDSLPEFIIEEIRRDKTFKILNETFQWIS